MSVRCSTCGREFPENVSATQSDGCATTVSVDASTGKRRADGHFGSRRDLLCYKLDADTLLQAGLACDRCVSIEILAGRAVKDDHAGARRLLPSHMTDGASDEDVMALHQVLKNLTTEIEAECGKAKSRPSDGASNVMAFPARSERRDPDS